MSRGRIKICLNIQHIRMLEKAVATHIRLTSSYINQTPEQQLEVIRYKLLQNVLEDIILKG